MSVTFTRQAEELLALTEEVELGGDLIAATRTLRDVAIECDAVNDRFEAAAQEVKRLLVGRIG